MATLLESYLHLSRLFFVFNTIGDIFFKFLNLTSIITRFVFQDHQDTASKETNNAIKSFASEAQSVLYLHPMLLSSVKDLFKEFHDYTLMCGQPMASILVTTQEDCRQCGKTLVVDSKQHPIVIYSSHRGSYVGCRLTKLCRKCKIYEHYGYWTINGQKHYDEQTLQLEFLPLKWLYLNNTAICLLSVQSLSALMHSHTTGDTVTIKTMPLKRITTKLKERKGNYQYL